MGLDWDGRSGGGKRWPESSPVELPGLAGGFGSRVRERVSDCPKIWDWDSIRIAFVLTEMGKTVRWAGLVGKSGAPLGPVGFTVASLTITPQSLCSHTSCPSVSRKPT